MITKSLDLNKNEPMTYEELRKVLFNVRDNVFLNILSDMFAEGSLVSNGDKYQLPQTMYAESVERANKKKQAIIDANNRLLKIRDKFTEPYYKIEDKLRDGFSIPHGWESTFVEVGNKLA